MSYYFEINKIYKENDINLKTYLESNLEKFTRSNMTNYKDISYKNYHIIEQRLNKYIDFIRSKQIKYKDSNKKNLEAIEYIVQIPLNFTGKKNQNKLNKFIEEFKEEYLIKDTWYFSFVRKTQGKSAYIHILCLDRIVFIDGKEVEVTKELKNDLFYDKTTGRRCKSDNPNAKLLKPKGKVVEKKTIYVTDKVRLEYINSNPKEEKNNKTYKNFTNLIRTKVIDQLLKKYFLNIYPKYFKDFKKKTVKRVVKKNGKKYYINKKTYLYNREEEYDQRRVNSYNSAINVLNSHYKELNDKDTNYIEKIKKELKNIEKTINIRVFERKINTFKQNFLYL